MRVLRVLALGLLGFGGIPALAGEITVQGEGAVDQAPDMAIITMGARFQSVTADEALSEVNERVAAILAMAAELGVEDRDIQTRGFFLNPLWEQSNTHKQQPRIRGYAAGNEVVIRFRDISNLGEVLDQIAREGANSFNGLSFGLQDSTAALAEARRRAVQDAVAKAELYAEAAGVTLGALKSLSEGHRNVPQPMFMARAEMALASDSMQVAAGEMKTSASVSLVFEIDQTAEAQSE